MGMLYGWLPKGARKQPKRERVFVPLKLPKPVARRSTGDDHKQYTSKGDGVGNATLTRAATYQDPMLAQREAAAQEVKHTVAPICNKGGYQLISNTADLKTAGRKV